MNLYKIVNNLNIFHLVIGHTGQHENTVIIGLSVLTRLLISVHP